MRNALLHNPEMNEIVFENRNKAYGAYVLRHDYERTMTRAMASGMLLFVCFISSPYLIHYLRGPGIDDTEIFTVDTPINLEHFKKEIPLPQRTPPKQQPQPIKRQIAFIAPTVRPDDEIVEANDPPEVETLQSNQIGTTTVENAIEGIDQGLLEDPNGSPDNSATIEEPTVYNAYAVEQQPEFPNGMAALYKYLRDHLHFPQTAIDNGISGTVYISFIISKDGIIQHATVLRGVGGGLDQEALRVVNQMPAWKPGKHNGKAVAVNFILPIKFQLLK